MNVCLKRLRVTISLVASLTFALVLCEPMTRVSADSIFPKVDLSADNIGPRPIEQLTSQVVARDYASAWMTMEQAVDDNRPALLDGYFTGWAKDHFSKLVADQQRTGLHTRYVDHGHKLEAVFYSPAGDLMQLRDRAQLEIQILDGDKVIDQQQVTQQYVVLMTPGADRWLVRDLRAVSETGR